MPTRAFLIGDFDCESNSFDIAIAIADKVNEIIDAVMERSEKETIDSLYTELDGLYESREAKLESYVHVIKNAEAAAKACKEQANEFYAKSKALDGLARRLKETLLGDLTQHGEKTANAGLFKITRRKSPASVYRSRASVRITPRIPTRSYRG